MDGYYYSSSSKDDNFSFYFDPDTSDSYDSSYSYYYDGNFIPSGDYASSFSYWFGGNYKVAPYTWIDFGIETGFYSGINGSLSYRVNTSKYVGDWTLYSSDVWVDDMVIYIGPQLGVNFIANMLDISVMATYQFLANKFVVDFGLGVAF